jgi:hypothetical protein
MSFHSGKYEKREGKIGERFERKRMGTGENRR